MSSRHQRDRSRRSRSRSRDDSRKREHHDAERSGHNSSSKDNRRYDNERRRNDQSPKRQSRPQYKREPEYNWGKTEVKSEKDDKTEAPKEKPNFEVTGKLAADTNTFNGVVVKYNQPPEARIPKLRWRLYPFKGDESLKTMFIHRQSAYLIGRDHKVADLPVDHPSCSKQHAVLQYRLVPETRPDGQSIKKIKPYVIDLGSANGTYLNNNRIETQRYYELFEKDVLKFGFSSREYVLMNEKSIDNKDEESDNQQHSSEESESEKQV